MKRLPVRFYTRISIIYNTHEKIYWNSSESSHEENFAIGIALPNPPRKFKIRFRAWQYNALTIMDRRLVGRYTWVEMIYSGKLLLLAS